MNMDYRATLTVDYSGATDANSRQKLFKAMQYAGWSYAETSAMYIECEDLLPILGGLEILSRALDAPGILSACTLTIQLVGPDRGAPGATSPQNAVRWVMSQPLPSDA